MKTLADFKQLKPAEKILLANAVSGEDAIINSSRPTAANKKNTVRASFIRWLALGGDAEHPLHAHGVQLAGAWVIEPLDLNGAQVNADLKLVNCYFADVIRLYGTHLTGTLNLHGSHCQGLNADRAQIAGGVFLRYGFNCSGTVRLLGANIGGNLECSNAKFNVPEGQVAIGADSAQIVGSVSLQEDFYSTGEVRLLGASIGGNLACSNATFDVPEGQNAISADGAQIAGIVFLDDGFNSTGTVRLVAATVKGGLKFIGNPSPICLDVSNAHIKWIQTNVAAWAENSNLHGFSYDQIRDDNWATTDYLVWLNKQPPSFYGNKAKPQLFKPQPWQQLIKTLRSMGHQQTADAIAMAFEQQLYAIGKVEGKFKRSLHWLFGQLAGYGYQPVHLVKIMLAVWLVFGGCYTAAAYYGVFAPSDPLVFQHADYKCCTPAGAGGTFDASIINNADDTGATHNWFTCGALKGEYTTFSPFVYSLDVILPLVDLGQEKTWGAFINTPKPHVVDEIMHVSISHVVRWLIWFEILFGWVASLILVAVLSGLSSRETK